MCVIEGVFGWKMQDTLHFNPGSNSYYPVRVKRLENQTCAVEGWLNPTEGRTLFRLAQECSNRGIIVEIGSWKGKSTIWLANGSRQGSGIKVHAIDPHTGSPEHRKVMERVWTFDEFKQNIKGAGVEDLVVPHVDFSHSVAKTFDQPVELIFIDGMHEYEAVKEDFDDWFPKVLDGGKMAFHDTTGWPGPLKVVSDCLFKSQHFRRIRFSKSLTYGEKVAQNTAIERFENRLMLRVFLIHAWLHRKIWRLTHRYLDFPLARALRFRLKGKSAGAGQLLGV